MFTLVSANTVACNGLTTCVVKPSGCGGATYAGKAAIDGSTKGLMITQNVDAGYSEILCVECANAGGSTVQHDGW